MLAYILGVATPFVIVAIYILARDTRSLYRSVIRYGGENPRVLTPPGRVLQRVLQALTGRRRGGLGGTGVDTGREPG